MNTADKARILQLAAFGEIVIGAIMGLVGLAIGNDIVAMIGGALFVLGIIQFYAWRMLARKRDGEGR